MTQPHQPLSEEIIDCEAAITATGRIQKLAAAGIAAALLLSIGFWTAEATTGSGGGFLGLIGFLFSAATIGLSVQWWNGRERAKKLEVDLAKLHDRRRRATSSAIPSKSNITQPQLAYRDKIPSLITEYRERAAYYRRIHSWLQSVVIVGSIAASSITSLAIAVKQVQWVAAIVTFMVGVAAGFIGC